MLKFEPPVRALPGERNGVLGSCSTALALFFVAETPPDVAVDGLEMTGEAWSVHQGRLLEPRAQGLA